MACLRGDDELPLPRAGWVHDTPHSTKTRAGHYAFETRKPLCPAASLSRSVCLYSGVPLINVRLSH